MNLKESIRRILREEKDQKKLIKGIIDSSDIFDYKHFCGFDIITPEERSDQYNFLNKNKIPYLIKVYFVGGPNSEVWPRTQAIRNKELDLMEELHEYIKSFVPFNIEMMGANVNSCDGYKKLMKRKYITDDLQESIRKVLREETEDITKKILNFLKRRFKVKKIPVRDEKTSRIVKTLFFEKNGKTWAIEKGLNERHQIAIILDVLITFEVIDPFNIYKRDFDYNEQKIVDAIKIFIDEVSL